MSPVIVWIFLKWIYLKIDCNFIMKVWIPKSVFLSGRNNLTCHVCEMFLLQHLTDQKINTKKQTLSPKGASHCCAFGQMIWHPLPTPKHTLKNTLLSMVYRYSTFSKSENLPRNVLFLWLNILSFHPSLILALPWLPLHHKAK